MNDLGQLGAIVRAYIFSITTDSADSKKHDDSANTKNLPTAGAASPLSEVALGFDTPVGGGWPTTSSRTSEGARQPQRLELGAQSAPIRGPGHALTAPSSPLRCRRGARDGLRLRGLDGLGLRPRRGRLRRLLQPLHRPPRSILQGEPRASILTPTHTLGHRTGTKLSPMPPLLPLRRRGLACGSPTPQPAPFRHVAQVVGPSQRRRRVPSRPPVEGRGGAVVALFRLLRPRHARAGDRRRLRRLRQRGRRAPRPCGAVGGRGGRRDAAWQALHARPSALCRPAARD